MELWTLVGENPDNDESVDPMTNRHLKYLNGDSFYATEVEARRAAEQYAYKRPEMTIHLMKSSSTCKAAMPCEWSPDDATGGGADNS